MPGADRIHFHFLAPDVFIYQHGFVFVHLHRGFQIVVHILFLAHDLHGPAAQHKAGTHQHGVSDAAGRVHAGLDAGDSFAPGLGNVQGQQQLFKQVPVLRTVDGIAVRADNLHAPFLQRIRQVDGRLSA